MSVRKIKQLISILKKLERIKASKKTRTKIFNQIPKEFKVIICLGCGKRYEDKDCGCPAGSAENLRSDSEIINLLRHW